MDWKAKWIWHEARGGAQNYYLCARKVFNVQENIKKADLHITADSRYVVWINDKRIGQGPIRSWPFAYHYDSYDLSHLLKPGENVIAVLGMHYGVGTFQYLPNPGGILAQIEMEDVDGEKHYVCTDRSWKLMHNPAYDSRTPRICCQQAWVEHYNANYDPEGWKDDPELDNSCWYEAKEIGPAGCEPWTNLVPRPIPFLTEEPMYPVSVIRSRLVKPPEQIWALNLRPNLMPHDIQANRMPLCGFLATTVKVNEKQKVTLKQQTSGVRGRLRVNGVDVQKTGDYQSRWAGGTNGTFELEPGENLLLWNVTGNYHEWSIS
ncbi:alpha-L-rhamnosidase, partial [Candidatus Poribacteria bacterium]|nr:alpha-L-rhamnosidase [Candidatus Poribacteria bacterium]